MEPSQVDPEAGSSSRRRAPSPIAVRDMPSGRGAALSRPLCRLLLRLGWSVRIFGEENVPAAGPVILAGNHIGVFDGPVLFGTCPRPAHVVTKREVFVGPVAPVLRGVGQIPINRWTIDFPAVLAALRVLAGGRVLGLYPEGERGDGDFSQIRDGVTYFALRTGAPVVPVANFGVVRPGQNTSMPPRLRAPVDVVYGTPFHVAAAEPWGPYLPRRLVTEASERVRHRLLDHLRYASEFTGHPVPASAAAHRSGRQQKYGPDPAGPSLDGHGGPARPAQEEPHREPSRSED